jgi:hypothetical protein
VGQVFGIGIEDAAGGEADGDQAFLRKNEAGGRAAGSVIGDGDQRHAEIQCAVAAGEAAGGLDFADGGFGGNGVACRGLHPGDFVWRGIL